VPVRLRWAVAVLLGFLLLTGQAAAHTPIFLRDEQGPGVHVHRPIRDPERSWAIYGRLGPGVSRNDCCQAGYADVVPIAARQGQRLYLQVLVPKRDELKEFRPRAVLIGPGLPQMEPCPPKLPLQPAHGSGCLPVPELKQPADLYEGFTQTRYWVLGSVSSTFPGTGDYALVIYDPLGVGGPYTVAVGQREVFSPLDLLTFPLTWVRVHVWLWK
jgi:hypothetical protein